MLGKRPRGTMLPGESCNALRICGGAPRRVIALTRSVPPPSTPSPRSTAVSPQDQALLYGSILQQKQQQFLAMQNQVLRLGPAPSPPDDGQCACMQPRRCVRPRPAPARA